MAEQKNILQLNNGIPITDPTGGYLYIVKDNNDYAISYEDLVSLVSNTQPYRQNMSETCNGTSSQVITYSTPFIAIQPLINDFQGNGVEVISWDEYGFTIKSLKPGLFGWRVMDDK